MIGYYNQNEFIELYGTIGELVDMRDEIDEFTESDDEIWIVDLEYDSGTRNTEKCLSQIIFQKAIGKLNIQIVDNLLIISGATKHYLPLSSYFHFDEFDTYPERDRLENRQDHPFLDPKSLSITIGIKNTAKLPNKAL